MRRSMTSSKNNMTQTAADAALDRSSLPPGLFRFGSLQPLYESGAQCHRQGCPCITVATTTRLPAGNSRTRLLNRVGLLGFLATLTRQRLLLEQRLGVEGFELNALVLDDGDVFTPRLPLGLVVGARSEERRVGTAGTCRTALV